MGNEIKFYRSQAGFTQETAARALGVSLSTMSKWEQGRVDPGSTGLIAMSQLFGCSIDDILGLPPIEEDAYSYESEVLAILRSITPEQRATVLAMLRGLV